MIKKNIGGEEQNTQRETSSFFLTVRMVGQKEVGRKIMGKDVKDETKRHGQVKDGKDVGLFLFFGELAYSLRLVK